jgi:hypothetical protein
MMHSFQLSILQACQLSGQEGFQLSWYRTQLRLVDYIGQSVSAAEIPAL